MTLQGARQLGHAQRLAQDRDESCRKQRVMQCRFTGGGMGDCRRVDATFAQGGQQVLAGAVGQVGIDQQQRMGMGARDLQGVGNAAGHVHVRGQRRHDVAQEGRADRIVFDHQDSWHRSWRWFVHRTLAVAGYAARMSRPMLTISNFAFHVLLVALLCASPMAGARVAQARISKVTTPVATLEGVRIKLDWPDGAGTGTLDLWAARVDATDLGYAYRDLHWRCGMQRADHDGWQCDGPLNAEGHSESLQLAVHIDAAETRAALNQGAARIALDRNAASPDLTSVDLTKVPLAWAQALLSKAWPDARLTSGELDGSLLIDAAAGRPLRIAGPMTVRGMGLETADASTAAEHLDGRFNIDYRTTPALSLLSVDGNLLGGEFLTGNTYVALPSSPVGVRIDAMQHPGAGWELPRIEWHDGTALEAEWQRCVRHRRQPGQPRHRHQEPRHVAAARALPVRLAGPVRPGRGRPEGRDGPQGAGARWRVEPGSMPSCKASISVIPTNVSCSTACRATCVIPTVLRCSASCDWKSGKLYGLDFDASRLPFKSDGGLLRFREDAVVPVMGGRMTFRDLVIRPPQGDAGADIRFALVLDDIDFGRVSKALGLPAFQGRLSGTIPKAHYANERVDFDGGLSMNLFDGRVAFSSLALERPFGSAPSLSADIAFEDLDLLRLTEVLDFGSITGRVRRPHQCPAPGRLDARRLRCAVRDRQPGRRQTAHQPARRAEHFQCR